MNRIEREVLKRLKIVGKKYGFKNEESNRLSIIRKLDNDIEEISGNVVYWAGEYNGVFVYGNIKNNIECYIEKYYTQISPCINGRPPSVYFREIYANESLKEKLNVMHQFTIEDSPEGITVFCDLVECNVTEKMLPLAEKFNDLKYLEECIRKALCDYTDLSTENKGNNLYKFINPIGGCEFRVLVIAKLAGVDDYERIYQNLLNECNRLANKDDFFKNYPVVMESLYKDLKQVK